MANSNQHLPMAPEYFFAVDVRLPNEAAVLRDVKMEVLKHRRLSGLPCAVTPVSIRKENEIRGIEFKSTNVSAESRRRSKRMMKAIERGLRNRSTLFERRTSNAGTRVINTRANRKKLMCNYMQAGYSTAEAKIEVAKLIKVINGVSYLAIGRSTFKAKMTHRDYFSLPTRPGVFFRRPKDDEQVFASINEAENMLGKEIGPVKMEPMWNGVGYAIVPKEQ